MSSKHSATRGLNIRWTIGDVSPAGFEALQLSVRGAQRLFGRAAYYHICVNSLSVAAARRRAGISSRAVHWHSIGHEVPKVLRPFLDGAMSEGTAWKLIPLQLDRSSRELALDNDVILWKLPEALACWLADDGDAAVIAADVVPAHGQFAALCGSEPRNSGIRGTPAGFDLGSAIAAVLRERPVKLRSELDEQGLQIAALSRCTKPFVVTTDEVSICSPFPPHQPGLGRCGAHFVGLNARTLPWSYYGRPAHELRLDHWRARRAELYDRLALDPSKACKERRRGPRDGSTTTSRDT